jgi:spermidine/putrescine transport system ATP-binding protein
MQMSANVKAVTSGTTAIDIRTLSKDFGSGDAKVTALDKVSLVIRENEFFTLLGPSGCGKTTLLRMIAGFDFPDDGQVLLHGEDIAPLPPFRRPINTVFQSYALFPHMTVGQNIAFGLRMLGRPKAEIQNRVTEMLELVRMVELKDRRTAQISGGQQQRVALARALAPKPKVLLLDEPLSALDYKLRKDMQIELKRMQAETGITFVFVTHDQEEALTMSDRIAVMSRGKILQIGTPREIYGKPTDRFVASFIGETNFLPCRIAHGGNGSTCVQLRTGTRISLAAAASFADGSAATLSIRPEHARLTPVSGNGLLPVTIEDVIFIGTGTVVRARLEDGTIFIVRRQDTGIDAELEIGQRAGIAFADGAARLLRD